MHLLVTLAPPRAEAVVLLRAKAIVRTRVEPKTFFANERTFLQWLQISVLIMFMGLSLLGTSSLAGGSTGAGGCSESATSIGCKASKVLQQCMVQLTAGLWTAQTLRHAPGPGVVLLGCCTPPSCLPLCRHSRAALQA